MQKIIARRLELLLVLGFLSSSAPARAAMALGTGNGSLLGGDLTDPEDRIAPKEDCGGDLPGAKLGPGNCALPPRRHALYTGAWCAFLVGDVPAVQRRPDIRGA